MTFAEAEGREPATGPLVNRLSPAEIRSILRRRRGSILVTATAAGAASSSRSRGTGRGGENQSNANTVVDDNVIEGVWVLGVYVVLTDACVTTPQQRIVRENSSNDLVRETNT